MGHVTGVADAHARAIAELAESMNCFIFIRPSTDDTVRLIEAGFATKSNDVHDKSSDWGPMAGFVPVDSGLNKKNRSPKLDGAQLRARRHSPHGIEQAVHLAIDSRLAGKQPMNPVASAPGVPSGILATHQFYRARKHGEPYFARHRTNGQIFWWDARASALVPVMVWGYHNVPITGDYDLWMVAPHMSHAQKFGLEALVQIYGTIDEHNTASAATPFLLKLNARLNRACRQAIPGSKQVFNHGAEAQNYGFTQALDSQMAMFTPGRTMRNIPTGKGLARALNEMEHRGYLVIHNKQWHARNALLGGEKKTAGGHMWNVARTGSLLSARGGFKQARADLRQKQGFKNVAGAWVRSEDDEKGYRADLAARKTLGEFRDALDHQRAESAHALQTLERADFPASMQLVTDKQLAYQRAASDKARDSVFGAGQNQATGDNLYDVSKLGNSSLPTESLRRQPLRPNPKH